MKYLIYLNEYLIHLNELRKLCKKNVVNFLKEFLLMLILIKWTDINESTCFFKCKEKQEIDPSNFFVLFSPISKNLFRSTYIMNFLSILARLKNWRCPGRSYLLRPWICWTSCIELIEVHHVLLWDPCSVCIASTEEAHNFRARLACLG